MTSWLLLVFTTLGAGATGAVITTYGTQSRDRRQARAQVRACLVRAGNIAKQDDMSHSDVLRAVAEVEDAAFIAAVPWHVVAIYRDARLTDDMAVRHQADPASRGQPFMDAGITGRAAYQASMLLVRVLWHPWLTFPGRRLRARRIRQFLCCGLPPDAVMEPGQRMARRAERKTIRDHKRASKQA